MRVALISEHASPLAVIGQVDAGGQNVHVAELAAGLSRLGHEVVVCTRRDDPALPERVRTPAGYEVVHLDAGPAVVLAKDDLWPHLPAFADELHRVLAGTRPDVLHAHFWMSAWAAREVSRRLGAPFVVTFHALGAVKQRHQGAADSSPPVRLEVEREVACAADRVVATCSDEVAELTRLGVPAGSTTVVPCGVDLELFSRPDGTAAAPGGAPTTPGGPRRQAHRLLSIGRLVPRKGFEVVIAALAELPDTELLIAGGRPAGDPVPEPEAQRLTDLAAAAGVADRVRLLGQVPRTDLPALIRSADLVVCAPWYEPFGLVPLEAMAAGTPVVGSAVGGLLDTVVDGVTGSLVPPRDAAALAGAVAHLLTRPGLRTAYAEAGQERVRRHYSWDRVAADTAAVYDAVRVGVPVGGPEGRP